MFHKSELGACGVLLPCDKNGNVPEAGDDWRAMDWELGELDCCDADTIELLDDVWWPKLIELADAVRKQAAQSLGT